MKLKKYCLFFILIFLNKSLFSQGTWIQQVPPSPPPKAFNSVSAVSLTCCWIAGEAGTVIYTSNGGTNWIYRNSGLPANGSVAVILGQSCDSAICGLNTTTGASIYTTTNQGQTWLQRFFRAGGYIDDIKPTPNFIFAYGDPVGGRWMLLRSVNRGLSWDTTGLFLPENPPGIYGWPNAMTTFTSFSSGLTTIWFGTNMNIVYRSNNNGATGSWIPFTMPNGMSDIFSIVVPAGTAGFCGGNGGGCSTVNGGNNWILEPNLPGSGSIHTFAFNTGFYWYGRSSRIYYSTDNGVSFGQQYINPTGGSYMHLSFVFSPFDAMTTVGGWGVGNDGAISKYTHNNIGIQPISTEIPAKFSLQQNYPNPFNPSTKIRFDIPANVKRETGNVVMKVYNMLGSEVAVLVDEKLSPGVYEVSFDASKYASGVYYYSLITDSYSETRKMILIK